MSASTRLARAAHGADAPDASAHATADPECSSRGRVRLRRTAVLGVCVAAAAGAAAAGQAGQPLAADPELTRLLRGMALVKAAMVTAGAAALLWRCAWPLPPRLSLAYGAGLAATAAAGVLVWQLVWLVPASVLFHAGGAVLIVAALRDGAGGALAHPSAEPVGRARRRDATPRSTPPRRVQRSG